MPKVRVYELAKELNVRNQDLLTLLQRLGVDAKNHMSVIEETLAQQIIQRVQAARQKSVQAPPPKPAAGAATGAAPATAKPPVKPAAAPAAAPALPAAAPPVPAARTSVTPSAAGQPRPAMRPGGPAPGGGRPERPGARPGANRPGAERPGFGGPRPGPGGPRPGFGTGRPGPGGPARSGGGVRPGVPRPGFGGAPRPGFGVTRPAAATPPEPVRRPAARAGSAPQQWKKKRASLGPVEKINVNTLLAEVTPDAAPSLPAEPLQPLRRGRVPSRPRSGVPGKRPQPVPQRPTKITVGPEITVKDLSALMGIEASQIIKKLMLLGTMATVNQIIDGETAALVASEFGIEAEIQERKSLEELYLAEDEQEEGRHLLPRPPVVTIMGHVDHGKTTLLDVIRETRVAASEAGGITQHIGAYQVDLKGKRITFLDTPGHEAFTAMRARGAQVTDIAVLVVAADDGVMPQTVEAINHAKAAGVPIIVAINKIDKPNAQPERVKQELTEYGLVPEEWGGDTIMVPCSALRKEGIGNLLEMILLVAELRELKANPARKARGVVIEAQLDKGRGPVATVLVQKGTLQVGDSIVAGAVAGKVRAMVNDKGRNVKKAGPSTPVQVLGLSDVPLAGDPFVVVEEDKVARLIAQKRTEAVRLESLAKPTRLSLEELYSKIKQGEVKTLNLVLKADVQGSVEALKASLERLSTDEVRVNVMHAGVGAISESDVMLASASGAVIIGFNVRPDANAKAVAEREGVDLRLHRIIYEALDEVKAAMFGLLAPEVKESTLGRAEVRQVFRVPKVGTVAGCYVLEGKITRTAQVRILRDNVVVYEGKLASLRRFKDDVREVAAGYECGIGLEKFQDIKEGDIIEAFEMVEVKRQA
ncbi:MAG: translation initiation factor IF-2 [Betaproteobacteria bacterium]